MSDKATPRQRVPEQYHSDAAHTRQSNAENMVAWQQEIHQRIKEYPADIKQYLENMVPSDVSPPCCSPTGKLFMAIPVGKEEEEEETMYNPMVTALTRLVQSCPPNKRLLFHNYNHKAMKFPFQLYEWRHIALVFELKRDTSDDPMIKTTITHWETLVQLAKSARNIMVAQSLLYAYVVGIYGTVARIFRFDHAGAICTPLFEYREQPKIVHELLWRLFHPRVEGCAMVGEDPMTRLGTSAERELAYELAKAVDPSWKPTAETWKAVRRIIITGENGGKVTYLAYRLLFINPRLFSWATLIWEAFKLDDEGWSSPDERYIIKETWQQLGCVCETEFYKVLQMTKQGKEIKGVAMYLHSEDLGDLDKADRRWKAAASDSESLLRTYWDMKAGYLTISGWHNDPNQEQFNEQSHMRIVLKTVGAPLTDFTCTKELVMALRDAIEAYNEGIIHRDISKGNVMIARNNGAFAGFIQDFDYSFSWKRFLKKHGMKPSLTSWEKYCVEHGHEPCNKNDPADAFKERTGTILFMAIDILRSEITHEAQHDLESFYWLLVFIVLRHTTHGHHLKKGACGSLFCLSDWDQCTSRKFGWLLDTTPPLTVPGNGSLNALLNKFRLALMCNFPQHHVPVRHVTHCKILNIFNEVLAPDMIWPEGDAALEWIPPKNRLHTSIMEELLNLPLTKGTLDHTTTAEAQFLQAPVFEDQDLLNYIGSKDEDNNSPQKDATGSAAHEVDGPVDAEAAFWQDRSIRSNSVARSELSVSEPLAQKALSRKQAHSSTRKDHHMELPPRAKWSAARRADSLHSVAETWPAGSANVDGAKPGHHYNLRSSNHRDLGTM
ncbi:hypothetical protein DAEQUDRAFT_742137, partial [Daedalea quercina L-15889]